MRGVYCDGQTLTLRNDLNIPDAGPGEVLLKVRLAGICDTDLQLARGYMGYRGVLGHEFIGMRSDGRRCTSEINFPCHDCQTCRAGRSNHCPYRQVLGILAHDGAMADWVAVPESAIHEVPDTIDDRSAVWIEPLAAAFRMLEQVKVGPGTALCVLGDGKLGILCARLASLSGAEVRLVGKHPGKLALAGPAIQISLLEESHGMGRPFDVVVEATGSLSGLETALKLVRPRGTIVMKTTLAARHEIDLSPIVIDEIRVVGSRCGPFPRAIEALASRAIQVHDLIEATYPLDQADEAFRHATLPGTRKILLEIGSAD